MKKFLAIYLGTEEGFAKYKAMDEKMRKERDTSGMTAWSKWATDNKKSILDMGAPLGKTKRIDKNGIADTKNGLGAYTVVEALSHEDAAKLFLNHPHFTIFPGESVEVMECLPLPGM
jgi:hemolysin-activating ACP:hemolysin acyltransferase